MDETAEYLPMFLADGREALTHEIVHAGADFAVMSDGQIALIVDCDAVAEGVA